MREKLLQIAKELEAEAQMIYRETSDERPETKALDDTVAATLSIIGEIFRGVLNEGLPNSRKHDSASTAGDVPGCSDAGK